MGSKKTIRNKLFFYALAILFCLISNTYAWDNNKFLDNSFWNTDPSTWEIISALYWTDSIYTSNRTGYDSTSCENMQVQYISTLPNTLSGNTIYVLSSDINVTNQINFSKCSAIVWSWNININTTVTYPDSTFHIWSGFWIVDNLNIIWNNNIYFYWVYWSWNNKTLNNLHLSWLHAWILFKRSSYNYINNIDIYSDWWNLNSRCTSICDFDWLSFYDNCKHNKIENINSFWNCYWVLLYDNCSNNKINNIESYDNYYYWLGLYTNCNYNIINNVTSYNNVQNGIWLYDLSNYNSLNNLQSFNNWNQSYYAWFLIDNSHNNIINNSIFYNNTKWIWNRDDRPGKNNIFINISIYNNKLFWSSISGNNNKYYWILNSFANGWNNEFTVLEKWDSTWILPEWQLTWWELSRDLITNPKNESKYILDWSKSLSWNRWVNEKFNNKAISYSFWTKIPTQSELYVWNWDEIITIWTANDNYIGSNTKKIEWKFLTNWINIVWTTTSENINKRIYLNTPWISGDINTYQWLDDNLTKSRTKSNTKSINPWNTEPMIWQFVIKWWNYMHTIAEEDTTVPTCKIKYSTTTATTSNVIASLNDCSEYITWTELSHTFTENWKYTFTFYDAIWNTGTTEAEVTRIYKATNNWWGGSTTSKDNCPNGDYSDSYYDWTCGTKPQDSSSQAPQNDEQTSQNYEWNNELQTAYEFAYENKITTMDSIEKADMEWNLTRIEMAKMLSKYATNVLWKKPANKVIPKFSDITEELDAEYDYWVSLAYQLWIMWINMPDDKFRPFDLVTRAEFVTALSRMRYWTSDGEYVWTTKFYKNHMELLNKLWIISITDPDMEELRWYVMLMLMRSFWINMVENSNITETEYNEGNSQPINKYFTEPYRKGQIYKKIGDLQDLLRYLGFYNWKSNSVYNKATINAVYDFQVAMWLIDVDDVNNPAKWYLWPETRKLLNEKWIEFQQIK